MSIFGTPDFVSGGFGNPSTSGTFNCAIGDAIAVFATGFSFTGTMSCADLAGNSYSPIGSAFSTPGGKSIQLFQTIATAAMTGNQVEVTGAGGSVPGIVVHHWPVSGTAVFDDASSGAISSSLATFDVPSFNTSGSDEVVGLYAENDGGATVTGAGGYTSDGTSGSISGAHGSYSSTQTGITPGISFNAAATGAAAAIAFKSNAAAYSISGNAGVAGATVAYTGTSSGSVTADGSGNYTIPSLANGSYTITPSKAGYTFSPTNSSQTVSGSNITGVNFTASGSPASGAAVVCVMQ